MSAFLLDTNHLAHVFDSHSNLLSRIRKELAAGAVVGTCIPVLCELEAGIAQVRDPDRYRLALVRFLVRIRIWPLTPQAAVLYGELFNYLRQRGRVLSQVDIMVAALARQMNACVLTTDGDFNAVSGLPTENWLA